MTHPLPINRRAGGRHSLSSLRSKCARTAVLLGTCCMPAMAASAQNCPPPPSHGLATNLATIKVGQYWIYEQTGTLELPASATPPGGTAAAGTPPAGTSGAAAAIGGPTPPSGAAPSGPVPLTGTFVETVETRMFQGQPTLALVVVQNLTANGVSIYGSNPAPQQIFYVQQDPKTNDLLVVGDNAGPGGTDEAATTPAAFYPGSWSASTSYNDALAFPSGNQTGLYLNVTGTQTVATRIGNFDAWVAPNGATTATGGVLATGIDYWTPQLGAPVAFSTVTNLPDGSVRTLNATLIKSSEVPSLYPVVADKLSHPRGLAFGPYGGLWLTEAGVGGTGPCIPFMGTTNCFGNSGRVSVIREQQNPTVTNTLASLATPLVDQATGPNGIAFANGKPYVIVGNGGPQGATNALGPLESQMGVLLSLGANQSGVNTKTVASVANYEYVNDPDHRPNPDGTLTPESNPYGVTSIGEDAYVAEGGAHTILKVTPQGGISVVGIIPPQMVDQPAFPGGPVPSLEDSVPTGITPAPYGQGLLVADYTGFPYVPGTAKIWQVQEGQAPKVFASGFTNLVGLSPAPDGGIYALEMASNGALSGDPGGSVIHVSPQGVQNVIACQGLIQPTGIATSPYGDVYVSNYGVTPGYGQVVKVISGY